MGQKPSQITHDIEETRARLGWNLRELEHKVKRVTDWRQQFEKRPFAMMGVALGGGMLLASAFGLRSRRSRRQRAVDHFFQEVLPAFREELQTLRSQRGG